MSYNIGIAVSITAGTTFLSALGTALLAGSSTGTTNTMSALLLFFPNIGNRNTYNDQDHNYNNQINHSIAPFLKTLFPW